MKQIILGAMLAILWIAGPMAAQQNGNSTNASAPSGPGAKLRTDLAKAVQNGHMTDEQKKTLQDAGAKLREAAQARQNGDKPDLSSVKKALGDIKKVAESGAFQPDDAAAVKADLEAMQQGRGGQGRHRLFRHG